MAELGAVNVKIGADTSGLDSGMKRAKTQMRQLGKEAREGATKLAKYGAAATAAGIAVSAALVKRSINATDALAKMSQRLGVATEDLQGLRRAAQLTGVQTQSLDMGLQRMVRRVAEAAKGTGEAQDAIKELGLEAKSLAQLSPDEQFRRIAGAMQGVTNQSDRVRLAFKLFDSEGVALVNTLDLGEQGLDRINSQMARLGVELSSVDAAQMEAANDAFADMSFLADSLIQQFSKEMAPVIVGVAEALTKAAEEAGGFDNIASEAFDNVVQAAGFVLDAVDGIGRVFESVADTAIIAFSGMAAGVSTALLRIVELVDAIPGVDMSESLNAIRGFRDQSIQVMKEATNNIGQTLNEPLPSDGLKQFVEDAKVAGRQAAEATAKAREEMRQGMGGEGDGTTDPEAEKRKQELDALQAKFDQEFKIEQEHLQRMKELRQLNREGRFESEKAFNQALAEEERRFAQQQMEMEKQKYQGLEGLAKKHWGAEKATAIGALQGIASVLSSENNKMFEANKAFATADALVSTYQAVANGLATKPFFPVGLAMAAKAAAVGFKQVKAIQSQSASGGGGGSSGSATGGAGGGGGGQAQPVVERVQEISITGFNPDQLVTGSAVDGIIDAINERSRDGKVVLARG